MNIKIKLFFSLSLIYPMILNADFTCSTNVLYTWTKEDKVSTVPYKQIEAQGIDEESAKENIMKMGFPIKQHAFEACRLEHQNFAACLSTKLKSFTTTNANLGFKSKDLITDAIKSDCENVSGLCKEAKLDEIICKEIIVKKDEEVVDDTDDKKKAKNKKK